MQKATVEKTLRAFFATRPEVIMAFLFGSTAKGRATADSDLDVAAYFANPEEQAKLLWDELEACLKMPVDLIVLNDCAPGIALSALKGIPLDIKNKHFYQAYLLDKSREAEDFRGFLEELFALRSARRLRGRGNQICN